MLMEDVKYGFIDRHREEIIIKTLELDKYFDEHWNVAAVFYEGPWGEFNVRFILTKEYFEGIEWIQNIAPKYYRDKSLIYFNKSVARFDIIDNKLYDNFLEEFVK